MGWRGLLRSVEADRRRNDRISQRKNRLLDKANSVANKFINSMAEEAQRELEKIKAYEERLSDYPISKCGLQFSQPNKWAFDGISDNKGQITYDLKVAFSGDDLSVEPAEILYEKRCFKVLNACVTNYGIFVAFEISYDKSVTGSKSTKLINKKSPDNSLIAIRAGDQIFFPVEGTIDASLVDNVKRTGIIVFESFLDSVSEFDVVFIPKTDEDEQPENIIKFSGNIECIIQNNSSTKSLYENFLEKLNHQKIECENRISKELEAVKQTAEQQHLQQARQQGAGCFPFSLLSLALVFLLIVFASASSSPSRTTSIPPPPAYSPPMVESFMAEQAPAPAPPKKKPAKMKIAGYVTPEGEKLHRRASCGGRNSQVVYSTDWQASLSKCSKCW